MNDACRERIIRILAREQLARELQDRAIRILECFEDNAMGKEIKGVFSTFLAENTEEMKRLLGELLGSSTPGTWDPLQFRGGKSKNDEMLNKIRNAVADRQSGKADGQDEKES